MITYSYYAVKKKNRRYIAVVRDDRMDEHPPDNVRAIIGKNAYEIVERVWRNPNKDAPKLLKALGYVKGGKAKDLMDYMVENGYVK